MAPTDPPRVLGIAEAREELPAAVRRFRERPHAAPILIGSHRKPEAMIVPIGFPSIGMPATGPLLDAVLARRRLIRRLAELSHIERVSVFGSVARRDDGPDSDLDVLVSPDPAATYFDLAQFETDLEELFGRTVDVVSERALDPTRDAGILAEAVRL